MWCSDSYPLCHLLLVLNFQMMNFKPKANTFLPELTCTNLSLSLKWECMIRCTCRRPSRRKEVVVRVRVRQMSVLISYGDFGLRQIRKHNTDERGENQWDKKNDSLYFVGHCRHKRVKYSASICYRSLYSACKGHVSFYFMASLSYNCVHFESWPLE